MSRLTRFFMVPLICLYNFGKSLTKTALALGGLTVPPRHLRGGRSPQGSGSGLFRNILWASTQMEMNVVPGMEWGEDERRLEASNSS